MKKYLVEINVNGVTVSGVETGEYAKEKRVWLAILQNYIVVAKCDTNGIPKEEGAAYDIALFDILFNCDDKSILYNSRHTAKIHLA